MKKKRAEDKKEGKEQKKEELVCGLRNFFALPTPTGRLALLAAPSVWASE